VQATLENTLQAEQRLEDLLSVMSNDNFRPDPIPTGVSNDTLTEDHILLEDPPMTLSNNTVGNSDDEGLREICGTEPLTKPPLDPQ